MLELLTEYARKHDLVAEPGFAPKPVRWGVECGGRLPSVVELPDTSGKKKGRVFSRCPDLSQPELKRGGAGCRHFLVDTADVVSLLSDPDDAKARAKHRYFVGLLLRASDVMPELGRVVECLEEEAWLDALRQDLVRLKARPTDNVTFSIDDAYLVDSEAWHDWWRDFRQSLSPAAKGKKGETPLMRCLVTGNLVKPVLTHPKVTGLADVGGQPAGDVLASFKQGSFRSYGLIQSANAAMSEETASLYRAALNDLLAHHSQRLGSVKVAHWFKKRVPPEDDPFGILAGTEDQERSAQIRIRKLLESIRSGERAEDLRGNHYYALTLSGAGGRVMVHDWMEGEFEDLVRAIAHWFNALEIVRRNGSGMAPSPKFMAVLGALVRDLKDLPPPTVTTMWRVALVEQAHIPDAILAQALQRFRVDVVKDDPVRHACAGLLRAYHVRKGDDLMNPGLNEEHPRAAYHCGRLMAVFAQLQYSALGDVGAGVVQRYYAAASATPALVLGRLTRNAQFHLDKLDGGLRGWYQKRLAGIMSRIQDEFPKTLDLEGQSLFALGYYQQMAQRSERKADDAPRTGEDSE